MNKSGEIIVIEDDQDDQELFADVFKNLKLTNKILFFADGASALEYLQLPGSEPFLILSDVNLPKLNGFELREKIFTNTELSKKCIPYIFFTTDASEASVASAYAFSAQGFFKKPATFQILEDTVKSIIDYWKKCYSPSDFNK
jgi:CheY-like chemotaxis protein